MLHEISDERYCFIEDTICDAFLLVLKEKEIDKITVTDIIKRAGIVRSTFYNHYENIPALITAVEDKTIQDIFTLMEDFHPENNQDICKSFFLTICNYMIACSIGSTLGVLHKWTRENFKSSEEIIAGILTQSFLTGILPYLS